MSLNPLILCPSARLARSIQNDIARAHLKQKKPQWHSPDVRTLSQWLECTIEEGLLTGDIEAQAVPYALSALNEQLLWEEVITQSLTKNAFGELFDVSGLANAAIEANRYVIAWNLHVPREYQSDESRQFIQWQRMFQQRCTQLNVLESVRYMDWQLAQLAKGAGSLPAHMQFAGFDQEAPQEKRLRETLVSRGVEISDYETTASEPAHAQHLCVENQAEECRAAVAWAQGCLAENPHAKLAIVVPRLNEIRNQLTDLLDDVFYPASLRPSLADTARHYNFSLGTPLAQQPIIQAALNLLRLLSTYQLQITDVSGLLLSPFWSASQQEADVRALLDARIREKLPMQFTLARLVEFVEKQHENDLNLTHLLADIKAAKLVVTTKKEPASYWAQTITTLLDALKWPGERNITSFEYQALNAWQKALLQLTRLDVLGKPLSISEAVHYMQQICSDQVFQAKTECEPSLQVLGIMEALSAPVDAIWCMHMNDHIWPPPARSNALLPAFIQRAAGVPNADDSIQAVFARTIHQRLLYSAQHIIFSSSKTEGQSQLRPSPLVQDIDIIKAVMPQAETLAEQLTHAGHVALEHIDDHIAPAVVKGEHVPGGTGLFKAQAICPAWAFYQYRLGAKALKMPATGLGGMERGSLVHDVLEQFWCKRHYADLRDVHSDVLSAALTQAINHALLAFAEKSNIASATMLALEHERLEKLIGDWLQFEKTRGVIFSIVACEAEKKVQIGGIEVTLKIDRIHQLENGKIEFIDYKTGQLPKINSWSEDRITEPQLPIYAAYFAEDASIIAGVHFAMVKIAGHAFSGVSEINFEDEAEKRKPDFVQNFHDWQHLLNHWKTSIEAIALEIRSGVATVQFNDEADLKYCEVLPLLRLPERKLQIERLKGSTQ